MKKIFLNWRLSHSSTLNGEKRDEIDASVPGAVQLDYAKAFGYAPYYRALNFRQFDWTEDEYFTYSAKLDFNVSPMDTAILCFEGIDYGYIITVDGKELACGEGAFTPVYIDVTPFSGKKSALNVTILPIPKLTADRNRTQAAACCKPASSYSWDWHPRLVPSGIWDEAYIKVIPYGSPMSLEASYVLSDDLKSVTVTAETDVCGCGTFTVSLADPNGNVVASEKRDVGEKQTERFVLTLDSPKLWFPRGYGDQPIYTLSVSGASSVTRRIGFRRSRLVRNYGDVQNYEADFPKSQLPAPATIEINGTRIFAKGSNLVNTEIFPCNMTDERYDELLMIAYNANMNILRLWGGGYINREHFYDKCDELGILVWQEFMLSCNLHPDTDAYLAVLKQEATTIIKRLRTHPCLAFWCGGNELFNSWSGMTVQSHPLRLLDSLCYELDRFTPFNMTSPLCGMGHGSYVKVIAGESGDALTGEEYISVIKRSVCTAYTEFGCNGGATPEYLKKYIMDEADYNDCNPENEVWRTHHAFGAWGEERWLGKSEIEYFFGKWDGTDDLMEKTLFLQSMAYKTMFEEMRRQWPYCSMAINWDLNEPLPCAAGNSLINWPAEPKPALDSVRDALRPVLASADMLKNRYLTNENLTAKIWLLNDTEKELAPQRIDVYLLCGDEKKKLATVNTSRLAPRSNADYGSVSFKVTDDFPERFKLLLECEGAPEYSSSYDLVHRIHSPASASKKQVGELGAQ